MKKIVLLFLSVIIFSCNSDDDLPELPETEFNLFTYGESMTDQEIFRAFNSDSDEFVPDIFRTNVLITDDNFEAVDDVLEGVGFAIELSLYGNFNEPLQPGNYTINNTQEIASASVLYSLNYDASQSLNTVISIESGIVAVRNFDTGYFIQIEAIDVNGNTFRGNFIGNSASIL